MANKRHRASVTYTAGPAAGGSGDAAFGNALAAQIIRIAIMVILLCGLIWLWPE